MKPNTYLNRRNAKDSDPFLFISYRHSDSEYVYSDLEKLYDGGLQFWYDDRIEDGESWKEYVRSILTKPNCKGVIFYVSTNSIVSEAIEEEILCFNGIRRKNPEFLMRIISIGDRPVMHILWDLVHSTDKDRFSMVLPQGRLINFLTMFKSEILYNGKKTPDDFSYHRRLIDGLKKYGVVTGSDSFIDDLIARGKFKRINDDIFINFGSYPSVLHNETPCPKENGDFELHGRRFRALEMRAFAYEPIRWQMMSMDGKVAVFVTEDVLDIGSWNDFGMWLEAFKEGSLNQEELRMAKNIGLLSADILRENQQRIVETKCTDYSSAKLRNRLLLILTGDPVEGTNKRICTNNKNVILQKGISPSAAGGLRLCVSIDFTE